MEKFAEKYNCIWQRTTLFLAVPILTYLLLNFFSQDNLTFLHLLFWLHLPFQMFHEYEEYVYPGGFMKYFNFYSGLKHDPPAESSPLTHIQCGVINMFLWGIIIAGAAVFNTSPVLAIAAMNIQLLNLLTHPLGFQFITPGYNPGMITCLILLLPLYYLSMFLSWKMFPTIQFYTGFCLGVLLVVLMGSWTVRNKRKYERGKNN